MPRAAVDLLAPCSWDEREAWQCLRPRALAECIGQRAIVESLGIVIQASKERGEPLDHVLLYGPPGLGKTSFSRVIANELGVQLRETSGPAMSRVDALVGILADMEEGDVLCIEAAHQLPAGVTDALCQVLSDFAVDIVFDKGVHTRVYRSRLPRFTVVATATRMGAVLRRLREHFGLCFEVQLYSAEDMANLVRRSAVLLGVEVEDVAARLIGERSRGTPRVANRLLRRVRDCAQVKGTGRITFEIATDALALEGIDDLGLTTWDRSVLTCLVEQYRGGPVAMRTLLGSLRREGRDLAEAIEPYLFASGLITSARRGVVATERAYRHLGYPPPSNHPG